MPLPDNLYVGTVSWSKPDGVGTLYPADLKPEKTVCNGTRTYAFFSNYYAGYGPGSAKLFEELWEKA